MVAGVVRARCHLVDEQGAVLFYEELDSHDPTISERAGHFFRDVAGFLCDAFCDPRRDDRDIKNVGSVAVLGGIIGSGLAVLAADDHHGNFLFERHPRLQHRALLAEFFPDLRRVFAAGDLELAFAVVAEIRGLQHARAAEFRHCAGQVVEGFDHPERSAGDAVLAEEILFPLAVLADADRFGRGVQADVFCHSTHGRERDILELDGGHGRLRAEGVQRLRIIEWLVDHLVRDLHGGSFQTARPDHGSHAHTPRRQRQHASELTPADHADDLLPVQGEKYGS